MQASVVRMLEQYIGDETFQQALQDYMKLYAWSNATTEVRCPVIKFVYV